MNAKALGVSVKTDGGASIVVLGNSNGGAIHLPRVSNGETLTKAHQPPLQERRMIVKLKKAIEELSLDILEKPLPHEEAHNNAIKLGIEALNTVKKWREQHRDLGFLLLAGETED